MGSRESRAETRCCRFGLLLLLLLVLLLLLLLVLLPLVHKVVFCFPVEIFQLTKWKFECAANAMGVIRNYEMSKVEGRQKHSIQKEFY
jgi:hypothetical protein